MLQIKPSELKSRPYQEELLDKSIEKNTIIYLETGSGKTYIAAMLMKELSKSTEEPYSNGGMRSIFLAPTVPLVRQQAEYLRTHTSLVLDCYFGEKIIDEKILDLWDAKIWEKELEKNQALVMTPKVLVDMIQHSFIDINRINLIIFDECHRATGASDYSQILRLCKNPDENNQTIRENIRILGLTASIVQTKCNLTKFNTDMKKLEENFCCNIETALVMDKDENGELKKRTKPEIYVIRYSSEEKHSKIFRRLEEIILSLDILEKRLNEHLKAEAEKSDLKDDLSFAKLENPYKFLRSVFTDLQHILVELGLYSFKKAYHETISTKKLDEKLAILLLNFAKLEGIENLVKTIVTYFDDLILNYLPDSLDQDINNILKYSSAKVKALVEIFRKVNVKDNVNADANSDIDSKFHSIVFVERKKTVYYLDALFKEFSVLEDLNFIKSTYIHGSSALNAEETMNHKKQIIELEKFRKHEINVLIATNIVEEGVDVPACNLIIRFSKAQNFCSFTQSKGRARSNKSSMYLLIDEAEAKECDTDLQNFLDIENDIERKLIEKQETIGMDEDSDVDKLNQLIPPYKKNNAEITCHTAISLLNRWVNTLEQSGCLYPVYKYDELNNLNTKLYRCKLWLPPNPILRKEIVTEYFQRKKWAKMKASLEMCKELDNAGQFSSNLLIVTRDQWIKPHFNIEEFEEKTNLPKVGTSKKKREFRKECIEELSDGHPKPDTDIYLYSFDITETPLAYLDLPDLMNKSVHLGYLSSKQHVSVPDFKLYQSSREFSVSINNKNTPNPIKLSQNELDLLKNVNNAIFNEMLKFDVNLDFEDGYCGGLVVILKKISSDLTDLSIDWETIHNLLQKENFLEYYTKNPTKLDLSNIVIKMNASKDSSNLDLKRQANRLFTVVSIRQDKSPLSSFSKHDTSKTFQSHFLTKYNLETSNLDQPMIELKEIKINMNFILRYKPIINSQVKNEAKEELFIGEHFIVLPFKRKYLFSFTMLPAIFHRLFTLKRAENLKIIIEESILKNLKIKKKLDESTWENSIRFNKLRLIEETDNESPFSSLSSEFNDDDENDFDHLSYCIQNLNSIGDDNLMTSNTSDPPPVLLIREDKLDLDREYSFPSTYAIYQCLTLKSAIDNFDLERYEILGDCFLKLTVVLKIYLMFSTTTEGNMAELKSQRVSNKYLYKLAQSKNLHQYINSINFQPKVNWPMLNMEKIPDDERFKFKLSDKSQADSIEALIGCYLVHVGPSGAKSFMHWLGFTVSDAEGVANLTEEVDLPKPLLASYIPENVNLNEFKRFEEIINYKFNDIVYLLQAFTHPSYTRNRYTASYQKLELVGDAVIDLLVTQYIFCDKKEHSPGELTDLRQSLVNNKFFSHLAVKYGFHKFFKYESQEISNKINEYTKYHIICDPDLNYLNKKEQVSDADKLDLDDYDIESPKFLADIFESVAGAIYLDSNCSLDAVWKSYFPLMEPYLVTFKKNPPMSPITALRKLKPYSRLETQVIESNENNETTVIVSIDNEIFTATSKNKCQSKLKAFKKAVKHFDKDGIIIFF